MHATVFGCVNAGLWLGDASSGWLGLPTGGWVIGLLIHGAVVGLQPVGSAVRQRMLQAERQRLRRR